MQLITFIILSLILRESFSLHESKITTRSFGSKPVQRNQFPYQAIVFTPITPGTEYGYRCSGALISDQYVLTCAHCLQHNRKVFIDLGAYELFNNQEEGRQRFEIARNDILVHINYDRRTRANDIAIIRLPEKVQFSRYIQPIILPYFDIKNLVGQKVILSGWGYTGDNNNRQSEALHYITSRIVSPHFCTKSYSGEFFSDKRQICINEEGKSACRGDSGSPIVLVTSDHNYILVGIHSYGHETGCETGIPQVSGRVTYFLNWIERNTIQ